MRWRKFWVVSSRMKVDWIFLVANVLLMAVGVSLVYSASPDTSLFQTYWFKQLVYFAFGVVLAVAVAVFVPIKTIRWVAPWAYTVSLLLLVVVLFFAGDVVKGAGRWIDFGFIKLQPSELAKIAYLLMLSSWLSKHPVDILNLKSFLVPGALFIVPFVLVLRQPDLSTALVFMVVTLVCFFFAGLRLSDVFFFCSPVISVVFSHSQFSYSQFLWGGFVCLLCFVLYRRKLPVAYTVVIILVNILAGYSSTMLWNHLEPHQQKRVETFLNPMSDPRGDGYQVLQSMTAIGSGGTYGKGYGEGSQTNLNFLPEEHTDFIFSVLGEQFGFLGCLITLILYFTFLWRAMEIAKVYAHPFVVLMTAGASAIFWFHIVVNIAMTIGLMPVTGLPLPFLSYGGSFAMTCLFLVGLLWNMRLQGRRLKS